MLKDQILKNNFFLKEKNNIFIINIVVIIFVCFSQKKNLCCKNIFKQKNDNIWKDM